MAAAQKNIKEIKAIKIYFFTFFLFVLSGNFDSLNVFDKSEQTAVSQVDQGQ